MKRLIGKEAALLTAPEHEAGPYCESVFLSRFFAGSLKREEAHEWIRTHFPAWPEEARRAADRIVAQKGAPKEARSGRLLWRRWWHPQQGERPLNGASRETALPFESPDQSLLLLARGYWYTGHEPYRRLLFTKANRFFSTGRSWGSARGAALPLWKGIWFLRFMAGRVAPDELMRLGRGLPDQAAREMKKKDGVERGLFLLMMGTLFTESLEARSWRSRGIVMLERELFRRVGRDGVSRSKILSDQIDLLQLYLQAILIGRRHEPLSDRAEQRVEKMLEFLSPQPRIPLLEPGRPQSLFSFSAVECRAIEKVLGLGAIIFQRSDWKDAGGHFSEEAFFLTGPAGYRFHQTKTAPPPPEGSLLFEEGGYAVLRSRTLDEKILVVRSSPPQEDRKEEGRLTLSMAAPGPLFLTDPQVTVTREEPRPGRGRWMPLAKNGTSHLPWTRTFLGEEFDYIEGEQPVDRSSPACKQRRSVFFIKPDYWIVHDLFSGEGIVHADWHLPFVSEAKIEGSLAEGFHVAAPDAHLWLMALGTHLKGVDASVQPSGKEVVVRSAGALPISLTTVLYPDRPDAFRRHDFKSLYFPSIEGGSAFEILTETYTDTFLFAPAGRRISLSNVRFEGERLFLRRDYFGEITRLFSLSGRSCLWEGKPLFESAQPIPFLELSYRRETLHVRGALSGRVSFYADGVEEVRVNGEKTYFSRDRDRLILHF
ncbi:MAG: hypothetical protein EPO39_07265 [Candidatus Manganitrophaceae bacterium]|nr:MAG: hypothetical protein EPO39_07265 [Candidatus Manganitrophaceae bacterium]